MSTRAFLRYDADPMTSPEPKLEACRFSTLVSKWLEFAYNLRWLLIAWKSM